MHVSARWQIWIKSAIRSRLGGNILALYAVQGLNYLLPLLVLPYLLRVLGPHDYGSIAFAQSLMSYAVLLTDFGFNLSATRAVSLAREDSLELAKIFWSTLAAKLLLLLAGLAVLIPAILLVPVFREQWPVMAASGLMVLGAIAFPQWYFQGLERMRMVAIIHVLAKVVTFTATFIFVHSKDDQLAAAIILSAPSLLAAIFCGFAIRLAAPVRFHPPGWTDVRGAFASSWHLFLSNAAATLYLNTNAFVLGLLSGNYAVALYTLANKIALSVFNLLGPVVQAVFPRASLLLHQPDNAEAKAFLRRLIRWLLPIAALLSVMLVILAPLIVQLLGGASFRDAVPVVRVMGVLPLVLTCATLLAQIIMVNVGLSRSLSRIYLVAGLVNLGMLPLLIRRFDAGGAALSLVLVEILGPILMVRAIRRAGTFTGRILPS